MLITNIIITEPKHENSSITNNHNDTYSGGETQGAQPTTHAPSWLGGLSFSAITRVYEPVLFASQILSVWTFKSCRAAAYTLRALAASGCGGVPQ